MILETFPCLLETHITFLVYSPQVFHPPETEDWFLEISSVTYRDSGVYECQVSTSPKVSLPIRLTVLGEHGGDLDE